MVDYFKSAQKIKVLLWHGGLGGNQIFREFWINKLYLLVAKEFERSILQTLMSK